MQRYEFSGHREASPGLWIPRWIRSIAYNVDESGSESARGIARDSLITITEARANSLPEDLRERFRRPSGAWKLAPNGAPVDEEPGGIEHLDNLSVWLRLFYATLEPEGYMSKYVLTVTILLALAAGLEFAFHFRLRGSRRRAIR